MTKAIPGYNGFYQVTTEGEVISPNGLKTQEKSYNGYLRVSLWNKGKGKHHLVHRLVAEAFIPNPDNLPMVNHIDGNKRNNNVSNLEWCNLSQNMIHAHRNGLITVRTTKVIQYTKDMQFVKAWESVTEASTTLHINHGNIVTVCNQNTPRKYAGGFIWRYANGRKQESHISR